MWKPTYAQTCSAIYFGCYALVGAALSSLGPALINLADQTGTDIGGVSCVFYLVSRSLTYPPWSLQVYLPRAVARVPYWLCYWRPSL